VVQFNAALSLSVPANKSLVGDPKSGTFSCVSPCVGELVFIVWSGAGRHNSTVRRLEIEISQFLIMINSCGCNNIAK